MYRSAAKTLKKRMGETPHRHTPCGHESKRTVIRHSLSSRASGMRRGRDSAVNKLTFMKLASSQRHHWEQPQRQL